MITLKDMEDLCAVARSKGMGDDVLIKFCAGATGVDANAKIELNAAVNMVAGSFIETAPGSETVLEAPEIVLNQ